MELVIIVKVLTTTILSEKCYKNVSVITISGHTDHPFIYYKYSSQTISQFKKKKKLLCHILWIHSFISRFLWSTHEQTTQWCSSWNRTIVSIHSESHTAIEEHLVLAQIMRNLCPFQKHIRLTWLDMRRSQQGGTVTKGFRVMVLLRDMHIPTHSNTLAHTSDSQEQVQTDEKAKSQEGQAIEGGC